MLRPVFVKHGRPEDPDVAFVIHQLGDVVSSSGLQIEFLSSHRRRFIYLPSDSEDVPFIPIRECPSFCVDRAHEPVYN